jgi:NTE family protein
LYAYGLTPAELKKIANQFSFPDYLLPLPFSRMIRTRPRTLLDFLLIDTYKTRLMKKMGLNQPDKIEMVFEKIVGEINIEELPLPFACNAVDLLGGQEIIFTQGKLAKAIRASMSLPFIFEPVSWNGHLLVDGGILNNAPIQAARQLGATKTLLVDIHRPLQKLSRENITNIFQLLQRLMETMSHHLSLGKIQEADYILRIDVPYDSLDFSRTSSIITTGEMAARENLDRIKKFLHL